VLSAIGASYAKNQIPVPAKAGIHGDAGTMPAVYLLASKPRGAIFSGIRREGGRMGPGLRRDGGNVSGAPSA